MLVSFSVDNYKSIRNGIHFSTEVPIEKLNHLKNNEAMIQGYNLFKTVAIYGANAAGKTNVIDSLGLMRSIVLNSGRNRILQSTDKIPHYPYRLNTSTENASTTFEIEFIVNDRKYRFGFEYDKNCFYAEWLYSFEPLNKSPKKFKKTPNLLYKRDIDKKTKIKVDEVYFPDGIALKETKLPDNQLFLWICDRNEVKVAKDIFKWFANSLRTLGNGSPNLTQDLMEESDLVKETVDSILGKANTYFSSVGYRKEPVDEKVFEHLIKFISAKHGVDESNIEKEVNHFYSIYEQYDENNQLVPDKLVNLDFYNDESDGTKRFFNIIGPIVDTVIDGCTLIIDELEDSLHFKLIHYLFDFIQSETENKQGQVIFTTHSPYILDMLDISQVWGVERDRVNGSELYPFDRYKTAYPLREEFEAGRVGAVPFLLPFSISERIKETAHKKSEKVKNTSKKAKVASDDAKK